MKLDFCHIINRHRRAPAIVLAHGPSLNLYLDKLEGLKHRGFILIGCNEWYLFHRQIYPHYWITANSVNNVVVDAPKINYFGVTLFYSDSIDLTSRGWVDANIFVDYLPYDQRHFKGKQCNASWYGCCDRIIPGRLTIQEQLSRYTKSSTHYGPGSTVTLHMLSFAILLGCDPIYFVGIDLDYRLGYAKNSINRATPEVDTLNDFVPDILKDMRVIKKSAQKIGVKIRNLNINSHYSTFPIGRLNI